MNSHKGHLDIAKVMGASERSALLREQVTRKRDIV